MRRWPTDEELKRLQEKEYKRAEKEIDAPDPICDCGNPGWACICQDLAYELGHYKDWTPFDYGESN